MFKNSNQPDNLLFVTGKLAEKSLHKVLQEVQSNPKTPTFKYRVEQIGALSFQASSALRQTRRFARRGI